MSSSFTVELRLNVSCRILNTNEFRLSYLTFAVLEGSTQFSLKQVDLEFKKNIRLNFFVCYLHRIQVLQNNFLLICNIHILEMMNCMFMNIQP